MVIGIPALNECICLSWMNCHIEAVPRREDLPLPSLSFNDNCWRAWLPSELGNQLPYWLKCRGNIIYYVVYWKPQNMFKRSYFIYSVSWLLISAGVLFWINCLIYLLVFFLGLYSQHYCWEELCICPAKGKTLLYHNLLWLKA